MIHLKLKVIFGSLLVVKSIQCNTCAKTSEPIVQVNQGKLRGTEEELLDGRPYYSFKGVPYAKPPVENLRFSAPLPRDPWSGVYDATKHGSVCTQFDSSIKQYTGNKDCLFVNIYTTNKRLNAFLRNPTPHQLSDVRWPAYSVQKRRLLVLQNETMVAHAHNTRIQFWDK